MLNLGNIFTKKYMPLTSRGAPSTCNNLATSWSRISMSLLWIPIELRIVTKLIYEVFFTLFCLCEKYQKCDDIACHREHVNFKFIEPLGHVVPKCGSNGRAKHINAKETEPS